MSIQGQAVRVAAVTGTIQLPPEIAFLARHGIPTDTLRKVAEIATAVGVTADEAALKSDLIDEITFYRALANELGLPFLADMEIDERVQYPESILAGLAPLEPGSGPAAYAFAPAREALVRLLAGPRRLGTGLAITTPSALRTCVLRARPRTIAWRGANELPDTKPEWSIRSGISWRQIGCFTLLSGSLSACVIWNASATLSLIMVLSSVVFLGMVTLRLAAARENIATEPGRQSNRHGDLDLPVYTVIVALYRERRVLPRLVGALMALDYPRPKLDIKLVIEADDEETLEGLRDLHLPAVFEVIVAPPGAPRTKPRALNIALPLARGEIVTVYDAEDVPHPGQLKLAVETFARAPLNVGCLQARLVIDNTDDSWVTRFFTIEYATLFDVINPGLARLDMPIPLGGTSNHFRWRALRRK